MPITFLTQLQLHSIKVFYMAHAQCKYLSGPQRFSHCLLATNYGTVQLITTHVHGFRQCSLQPGQKLIAGTYVRCSIHVKISLLYVYFVRSYLHISGSHVVLQSYNCVLVMLPL